MKVRFGRAKIYSDKDTEIPDDAYDFAFWNKGDDWAEIIYVLPADPDSVIKSKVTEILHHLNTSKGGYK
jgi:hypothetical protein